MTNDSMNETQMIERWKTFGRSGYEFHMIIPKTIFMEVKEFAKSNGINVDKYWTVKTPTVESLNAQPCDDVI